MIPNPIEASSPSIHDEDGMIISSEQLYRAEQYEKIDNGKVLLYNDLNPATLLFAIEEAKQLKPKQLKMNGSNFVKTLFNNGESKCMN